MIGGIQIMLSDLFAASTMLSFDSEFNPGRDQFARIGVSLSG